MKHQSHYSTDHDEIRRWVEARGGKPATVTGTQADSEAGVLRIDFPGYGEEQKLQHISWDEFFRKFDESNLAMVMQEETAGGQASRFSKLVSRESVGQRENQRRTDRGRGE